MPLQMTWRLASCWQAARRNTIKGGEGADAIIGANENDSLVGDKGNDRITTGKGDDTVDGGAGDDFIVMGDNFDPAFDVIKGGSGADTLSFTFQRGQHRVNPRRLDRY